MKNFMRKKLTHVHLINYKTRKWALEKIISTAVLKFLLSWCLKDKLHSIGGY